MSLFKVIMAVARGTTFDTGARVTMQVWATDRLDAAVQAEALADLSLDNTEYAHTRRVIPMRATAMPQPMALAA